MQHCSHGVMKWKRHGLSSTPSKTHGRRRRMRRVCFFILPAHGVRKKPTIFLPPMGERGEGCEHDDLPGSARDTRALPNPLNMPPVAETYSLGLPVELNRIDKE